MTITIIENANRIDLKTLKSLIKNGICYVKVPHQALDDLKQIEINGKRYFQQPKEAKEKDAFSTTQREGYLDQTKKGFSIERYITRGSKPTKAPLTSCAQNMEKVREHFKKQIALPLLSAIFLNLGIDKKNFKTITLNPDYTLSLIYYPPCDAEKLRLHSHKDTVLITLLWTNQPGFEAKIDGQWHAVDHKPEYVIAQLGLGLEMMTGNQCHAVEHRVTFPKEISRISIATFYRPNSNIPFVDYVSGQQLYPSFGEYVKEHVSATYTRKDKT